MPTKSELFSILQRETEAFSELPEKTRHRMKGEKGRGTAMLDGILEGLCGGLWQGALLPCVFLFGLYATLRTRFFQVTRFPRMLRETFGGLFGKSSESEGSVTPF